MSLDHDQVVALVKQLRSTTYNARAHLCSADSLADVVDGIADQMLELSNPRPEHPRGYRGHKPGECVEGCLCGPCEASRDALGTLIGHPLNRRAMEPDALERLDAELTAQREAATHSAMLDALAGEE
ncbi:MAG: hypothetical protein AB7G11_11185 [Phycisphaerales bacterium]